MPSTNTLMMFEIASDSHTLSASPAMVTNLPVSYLQLPGSTYAARSTSLATQYIYGEVGGVANWNLQALALFGSFTGDATVQVKLYSGAGRNGLAYDTGVDLVSSKGKTYFHKFTGAGNYQSYEIIIIDPTNPDGYHQLSRFAFGSYFQPAINIQPSFSYTPNTTSSHTRNAGGGLNIRVGGSFRDFSFDFADLDEDERAEIDTYLEYVGMHRDWLLAVFPESTYKYDFIRMVVFTDPPPIGFAYFEHYTAGFKVSDALGEGIASTTVVPVSTPPSTTPGSGGVGTANGYWIVMLNGREGATTVYPAASNGAGTIISVLYGNIIQRSTDYGTTYAQVTVPGVPLNLVDCAWTGDRFVLCGDSGDLYWSTTGATGTWTQVHADSAGVNGLTAVHGLNDVFIGAGNKIYAWTLLGGFGDLTLTAGWTESSAAFVIASQEYLFFAPSTGNRLYRYNFSTGMMTNFIPSGLPTVNYRGAIFAYTALVVVMSDGMVYISGDAGSSFVLWYSPPANYRVYDAVLTRRPELLLILERTDNDPNQRRVFSYIGGAGSFIELRIRITYDGRQMLLHESVRELVFDIVASTGGTLDAGIDTDYIEVRAVTSDGTRAVLPYTVSNGVVTWNANQAFTGKITLSVSGTVMEQSA